MTIRRRSAALVAWALTVTCLAGSPNYDSFSEADGYIATEQHEIAVWAVVRDPEQLEAVYRDVTSGNLRATHVFQQLEATFSASGRHLAEQISQPPCLIPGVRELSGMCVPGWSGLSYLSQDKPGGIRLRQAVFGAFAARARERGLQNQLVLSAAAGLISIELARAVLAEANAAAALARIPEAAKVGAGAADDVLHVTPQGVMLPKGAKHQIPAGYVENAKRPGSYGEIVDGKFVERLRIDPPTPPGKKGPNTSHYHLDGKGKHYSPAPGDKDPGFNP